MEKRWKTAERIAGGAYLFLALLAFSNAFFLNKPWDILWLCYWAALLIGISLLMHKRTLLWSQLLILFIPDVLWTLDAITSLVQGSSLLGITDYFFALPSFSQQLVSLMHPLTVLLGMYAYTRWAKPRATAALIAIIESATAFVLARLFTSAEHNINCAYRFCGNIDVGAYYALWWFAAMAVIIGVTYGIARWRGTTSHTPLRSRPSTA